MAYPSQTVRFLSLPESDPNTITHVDHHHPLELDESDIVWSSSSASAYSSDADSSRSPPPPYNSPPAANLRRPHHHRANLNHRPSNGLSAALSDDHLPPLVRRKSTLNPSLSAARMVPAVVRSDNTHTSHKGGGNGRYHQSAPVNVPVWTKRKAGRELDQLEKVDDEREDEEEMVPPHVIVARSHVTFSVFEGVGRTLKGRDLRSVRNAVFQKTGFID